MSNTSPLKQLDPPHQRKHPLASWLFTEMQNMRHFHERLAARWLERRGWVVFYLDEQARHCGNLTKGGDGTCWLGLYEEGRSTPATPRGKL